MREELRREIGSESETDDLAEQQTSARRSVELEAENGDTAEA